MASRQQLVVGVLHLRDDVSVNSGSETATTYEAVEPPHDEEFQGADEGAGAGVDGQEAKVTQANRAGKLPVKLKAEAVLFDPAVAKSWAEDASSSTEIMLRRSKAWLAQHEARSSGGDSSSQLQKPSEGSSHLGV